MKVQSTKRISPLFACAKFTAIYTSVYFGVRHFAFGREWDWGLFGFVLLFSGFLSYWVARYRSQSAHSHEKATMVDVPRA